VIKLLQGTLIAPGWAASLLKSVSCLEHEVSLLCAWLPLVLEGNGEQQCN